MWKIISDMVPCLILCLYHRNQNSVFTLSQQWWALWTPMSMHPGKVVNPLCVRLPFKKCESVFTFCAISWHHNPQRLVDSHQKRPAMWKVFSCHDIITKFYFHPMIVFVLFYRGSCYMDHQLEIKIIYFIKIDVIYIYICMHVCIHTCYNGTHSIPYFTSNTMDVHYAYSMVTGFSSTFKFAGGTKT